MECVDSKMPRYLRSCRLCGMHGSHQTMDGQLANRIRACFGLAISLKDNTLPKTVCTRCTAKVNEMDKYRKFFLYVQLEHFFKRSQYFDKTEQNCIKVLRESVIQVELPSTGDTKSIHPAERINQHRIREAPPRIELIITQNILQHPVGSRRSCVSSCRPSPSLYASRSRKRRTHHPPAFSSGRSRSSSSSRSSSPSPSYQRSCRSAPSASLRSPPSVTSSHVASPASGTSCPPPATNASSPVPSSKLCLPDPSKTKLPSTTSVALLAPTPTTALGHTIPLPPSRPILVTGLHPEAASIPVHPTVPSASSLVPIPSTGLQLPNPPSPAHTSVPSTIAHPQTPVVPSSIISPSVSPSPSSSPSSSFPPSPVSPRASPPFVHSRSLASSPTPSIIVPPVDIKEEDRIDDKSIETGKFNTLEVVQIAVPIGAVPGDSVESIGHKVKVRENTIKKEDNETVDVAHESLVTSPTAIVNEESLKLEVLETDLSTEDVMEDMIEVLEPEHLEQHAVDSTGDDIEGEFLSDNISSVGADTHEQESEAEDSTMVFGEEHLEVLLEENEKYETVSVEEAEMVEMVEILEAEFDTEGTTQGECDENIAEVSRRSVQETRRPVQETRRRRRSKISGKELYKSLLTECTVCHKNIERNRFEGHMNRHDKRRPYSCPTEGCTARFHCKHACRLHVRCRHGTETFPCQKCDKVYKAKRDLLGHMRETHSEPRFICDICKKKFTTKSRLKQHRIYHTDERNYSCHICKTRFYNNFQVKVHMRSHTKINPYRCTICTKEFRYRHTVKEHLTKDHGIENSAQDDWVIQFPEPDPDEVDIVEGETNMVRYNVQRLIEPNEDDAEDVATMT